MKLPGFRISEGPLPRVLRRAATIRQIVRPRTRLRAFSRVARVLGFAGAIRYQWARARFDRLKRGSTIRLSSRLSEHSLRCRAGTSDLQTFEHVYLEREYRCIDRIDRPRLIIDCGANVGYSAAYFLSRFPEADLIAVEPDAANVVMLCQNLAPWQERVTIHHAGLWSHATDLVMIEEPYRDGLEWTRQVREAKPDEAGAIPAVDVPHLLRESGHDRISLLKIDIEGAESVVFGSSRTDWLDSVDTLVIELHDDSVFGNPTEAFMNAVFGRGFEISTFGELTVCRRMRAEGDRSD
jgi:FkbM family methyltransferase